MNFEEIKEYLGNAKSIDEISQVSNGEKIILMRYGDGIGVCLFENKESLEKFIKEKEFLKNTLFGNNSLEFNNLEFNNLEFDKFLESQRSTSVQFKDPSEIGEDLYKKLKRERKEKKKVWKLEKRR